MTQENFPAHSVSETLASLTAALVSISILSIGIFTTSPAQAVTMGHPGAPTPAFSMRGSIGLGYTDMQLDGKTLATGQPLLDNLRRFRVIGKISIMATDWLELGGTIMGADARRGLTDFNGDLGIGGGGNVNFYPMLQEKFGVNVALGGGVSVTRNHGDTLDITPGALPDSRVSAKLKEREYHTQIIFSRSVSIWNIYGGVNWRLSDVSQTNPLEPQLGDIKGRNQFGMIVGVDYYVTPLVFFSLEGQNFHEDTLTAAIGLLLAPNKGGD